MKNNLTAGVGKGLATVVATISLLALPAQAWVNLIAVAVGHPGNPTDATTGLGRVDYNYWISKYEVTLAEYAEFLNAVARTDAYRLYSPGMGSNGNISGISRLGTNGNFTYQVIGDGNRPVTYVSWFDAARFVNWLNHGQPRGPQGPDTTETGAYALSGAQTGIFLRNPNCNYSIPSESEWYKAAFYQPAASGGDADGYWLYPTRANSQPNSRNGSTSDPNSANCYRNDGIANGFNGGYAVNNTNTIPVGNALLAVGSFTLARSYYGTFDQCGNVDEWNDAVVSGVSRGLRGGTWVINTTAEDAHMRAIDSLSTGPSVETSTAGFRVVLKTPQVFLNAIQEDGELHFSWPGDYKLQSQTVPAGPIGSPALSTGAASWIDHLGAGTNSAVVRINPSYESQFFRLIAR